MKLPKKDILTLAATMLAVVILTTFFIKNIPATSPTKHKNKITSLEIPILLYHYVEYNQDERDFIRDSLNVEPHVFEQQIITLKEAGYTFITPKEIPDLFETEDSLENKYVVLSFDDGYADFYTDVLPLLKKHNVKAVNYIVYNFIGKLNYMTKAQLKEVADSELVELGAHALNHTWLTGLSEHAIRNEVRLSKEYLERDYGYPVVSFAYPYGEYDAQSSRIVSEEGYTNAVTDDLGTLVEHNELFTMSRVRPGYNTGRKLLDYISSIAN